MTATKDADDLEHERRHIDASLADRIAELSAPASPARADRVLGAITDLLVEREELRLATARRAAERAGHPRRWLDHVETV